MTTISINDDVELRYEIKIYKIKIDSKVIQKFLKVKSNRYYLKWCFTC